MQRDTQKYSQYSNNGKFGVLHGRRILVPAEYDLIIFTYCWNNLEGLPENTPSWQLPESLKKTTDKKKYADNQYSLQKMLRCL